MVKLEAETQDAQTLRVEGVASLSQNSKTLTSSCTVLRSRKTLRQLSIWCQPCPTRAQRLMRGCPVPMLSTAAALTLQTKWRRSLVWVRVRVLNKGRPALHSMLCIPTAEDLQLLRDEPQCSGPEEPQHRDHLQHLLKRRSKKRKNSPQSSERREAKYSPPVSVKDSKSSSREEQVSGIERHSESSTSASQDPHPKPAVKCKSELGSSEHSEELVRGLWPEPLPSVMSHCSRVTLGWLTQCDFSLASGSGEALGFVSLAGLLYTLLRQPADQRGIVLLRNPSSLQYRYAQLHIEA